ncbi:MAG: hypothetical protein RLZZ08_1687 [Pseudomonadota bacterium]|jgi:ubiquinone/menaquinone biosynthesis C-methylase UbiE
MTGSTLDPQVQAQRDYYTRTAEHYEAMHVGHMDEHQIALSAFAGMAQMIGAGSVLDVGAGTGRAVRLLEQHLPEARIVGVEPVDALRAVGHASGIAPEQLVPGDAMALPFPDKSFDFVIETAVLHHVADPAAAVREMVRVARKCVLISDSNKFGQGSTAVRWAKQMIGALGLWRPLIWLSTGGKMAKWSEGDGVYFSYSVFDTMNEISGTFPRHIWLTSASIIGTDLKRGTTNVAVLALPA